METRYRVNLTGLHVNTGRVGDDLLLAIAERLERIATLMQDREEREASDAAWEETKALWRIQP